MPSRKHLTFDKAAFMHHMLKAYETQLLSLAEQICRKMKGSILNMEGKGLAMRDTWIRMVARSIGYRALRVDTPFGDEPWMIQVKLGPWQGSNARYSIKENTRMRALVVMYGTGRAIVDGNTYKNTYSYEGNKLKTVSHNTVGGTPDVTYTFDYDEFGNPKTTRIGTQMLSTNVYSTNGARTLKRVEYGNGDKINYTHDSFRRVIGICYDNDTEPRFKYEYGANGQIAYVHDGELNRTAWTEYDASERPIRTYLMENSTDTSLGTARYVNTINYDEFGNVAMHKEFVGSGAEYETTFAYDLDNRSTERRFGADNRKIVYAYDRVNRISRRTAVGASNYETMYTYLRPEDGDAFMSTPLVQTITQNGQNFSYTYDNVGNISSVTRNGLTTTYVYDNLEQLVRVNDPHANKTTVYEYDFGGNIKSYSEYTYTTGTLGTVMKTVSYVYDDANWKDKVTSVDGKEITYDSIGNPLTYDGWTFTWKAGHMLASMVNTDTNAQFAYDNNGMRIKKVVNGVTTNYTLNGKNIIHMAQNGNDLHFFYDAQGKPAMVRFNGADYFYVYNLQGDVVALIDVGGMQVVEYMYDAWGAPCAKTGSMAATLGTVNPFRYRGYVYDEETGLYYLHSRYYNPNLKRFISPDSYVTTWQGVLSCNMYAYCQNCPDNYLDEDGNLLQAARDRVVHDLVLNRIAKSDPDLSATKTCVYYNGKDWTDGIGFCDLYNTCTGEVWELKKNSKSRSCLTVNAQKQLGRYLKGRLKSNLELPLVRPSQTEIKGAAFNFAMGGDVYQVKYWNEGQGILRYDYNKIDYKEKITGLEAVVAATLIVILGYVTAQTSGLGLVLAF